MPIAETDSDSFLSVLALEDGLADILGKALRGIGLPLAEVLDRAHLSPPQWDELLEVPVGEMPDGLKSVLARVAFVLNLKFEGLLKLAQGHYQPPAQETILPSVRCFTTPFGGDMLVNAYLLWDPKTKLAAAFDTGTDVTPMIEVIQTQQLTLSRVFVTHTHWDHLADLERLMATYPEALGYGPAIENPLGLRPTQAAEGFCLGNLTIRVLDTSGHTPGGVSYFVAGLAKPLVLVGDALFAGSMGGARGPQYQQALKTNRDQLLSLPAETVVAPGHGPMTTMGYEVRFNPFFPDGIGV